MDVISLSSSSSANIPCGWFHETSILAKDSLVNKLDKLLLFLSMALCLCCGPYLQEQKVTAEEKNKKKKEQVSFSESLIALRHNDEGIHAPRAVFFLHSSYSSERIPTAAHVFATVWQLMVLNVKQTPSLPAPHKTNDFRAFYALNSDSCDSCRTRRGDGQATRQMRLKGTSYKITAARWPRGRG